MDPQEVHLFQGDSLLTINFGNISASFIKLLMYTMLVLYQMT